MSTTAHPCRIVTLFFLDPVRPDPVRLSFAQGSENVVYVRTRFCVVCRQHPRSSGLHQSANIIKSNKIRHLERTEYCQQLARLKISSASRSEGLVEAILMTTELITLLHTID